MSQQKETIANSMLEELGIGTPEEKQEEFRLTTERFKTERKDRAWKPPVPKSQRHSINKKPVTSAHEYAERHPEIKTPHTSSKALVDAVLLDLQKKGTMETNGTGAQVRYSTEDWNTIIRVLSTYFADVLEGAGFIYGGAENVLGLQRAVADIVKYRFKVRVGDAYMKIAIGDKE